MAFEGMDVDIVRNMGQTMQQIADHINNDIIRQIDGLVNQIPQDWKGPDATQFQSWWTSQHRGQLASAANDLHGLGQSALNNASAQEATSNH